MIEWSSRPMLFFSDKTCSRKKKMIASSQRRGTSIWRCREKVGCSSASVSCLSACVCMCAYVFMYVYICVHVCAYMCIHVNVHVSVCVHVHVCACVHVCALCVPCMYTCVYVHICFVHVCLHFSYAARALFHSCWSK